MKASVAVAATVTEGAAAQFTVTLTSATSTAADVVSYTVGGTVDGGRRLHGPERLIDQSRLASRAGRSRSGRLSDSVLDSGETLTVALTGCEHGGRDGHRGLHHGDDDDHGPRHGDGVGGLGERDRG